MTEVKTAAGQGMSGELEGAMSGFVNELKSFREDIQKKLHKQEERMTMLDRKTALRGRSPLSTSAEVEVPHQKAFNAYLRSGNDEGLRGLVVEEKGMTVASDGGFLAAPQVAETVQSALRNAASLRQLATVVQIESSSYEVLVETSEAAAGWSSENDVTETAAPKVERINIALQELSAMPKASQRLLDDAAFDIDGWLSERIAERFARAEADAFINGSGVGQPRGLMRQTFKPDGQQAANEIGQIKAASSLEDGNEGLMDALVDTIYALDAEYRANAAFLMNSRTAAVLRKLKDTDGRFIWSDSLTAGQPSMLMGFPVVICEAMPDKGALNNAIAFGDFRRAYTIAERPDLRVLRDPFSAKPHVLFYATKRVGGGVTDARAVKFLSFA